MYSYIVHDNILTILCKVSTTEATTQAIEPRPGCIAKALAIVGNKWTALILKELTDGPKRFCDFEAALKGISPRTLSQRLDDLEANNAIDKKPYSKTPPRMEYSLTKKGADLIPVLRQMADWGTKY